jgi:CubicO group peptidase (beta-lactamase class C family)
MTVALDFEENYSDKDSEYMQYREATAWNPVNQLDSGHGLESFLYSLSQLENEHGHSFLYRSPNSDLLGLILERAAGEPLSNLFSHYLWKPMGAASDGYITVDRFGAPRAAGGICITLHDLALIGQLFLNDGRVDGIQVIPPEWIEDTRNNGDQEVWDRGNYMQKLPDYRYRNKWYVSGDKDKTICARGIHGQLLYINPAREVVIARVSSHPDPLHDADTNAVMAAFDQMALECQ